LHKRERQLTDVASVLKVGTDGLNDRVTQMIDNVRQLEKELSRVKAKLASSQGDDLSAKVREINGIQVLATQLDDADVAALRAAVDQLKSKFKTAIVLLSSVNDGKVTLIAGVTSDLTKKYKAGDLVNFVAKQVGGKGGGRPDMAQAGGTQPELLDGAIESVFSWVRDNG